ncbi:MAG: type II CRISPR-associated endonuclease Cas1 [Bacteroidota bacterium]|nr:type II CRISPR-associated endonuclease Cas1 [Bacteroidota bacterium]
MLKRTLFIENSCHVSSKLNQLVLRNKKTDEEKQAPIEDLGVVVFENEETTFSLQAIANLNANNVAVIFCNQNHMPTSMLLNLEGNTLQSQLFQSQINASEPLKKQLWQQTIKSKISNQAKFLSSFGKETAFLKRCAENVKSGDTTNEEGKASRFYWQNLFNNRFPTEAFGNDGSNRKNVFTRDRDGEPPNNLLNYGYIILRAAVARSLTGSGLLPTLGIHHHNKYNAYCLADDIMEPYRPWVDLLVVRSIRDFKDISVIDKNIKLRLLTILTLDVSINDSISPLMVALSQTTASLAECFMGERKTIKYPEFTT